MGTANQALSCFPGDTLICYGDTILESITIITTFLVSLEQIAFKHESYDTGIPLNTLIQPTFENKGLAFEFLSGVVVGAVDHHRFQEIFLFEYILDFPH